MHSGIVGRQGQPKWIQLPIHNVFRTEDDVLQLCYILQLLGQILQPLSFELKRLFRAEISIVVSNAVIYQPSFRFHRVAVFTGLLLPKNQTTRVSLVVRDLTSNCHFAIIKNLYIKLHTTHKIIILDKMYSNFTIIATTTTKLRHFF